MFTSLEYNKKVLKCNKATLNNPVRIYGADGYELKCDSAHCSILAPVDWVDAVEPLPNGNFAYRYIYENILSKEEYEILRESLHKKLFNLLQKNADNATNAAHFIVWKLKDSPLKVWVDADADQENCSFEISVQTFTCDDKVDAIKLESDVIKFVERVAKNKNKPKCWLKSVETIHSGGRDYNRGGTFEPYSSQITFKFSVLSWQR